MRIVTFRWEQDAMAVAGVRVIRHPDETLRCGRRNGVVLAPRPWRPSLPARAGGATGASKAVPRGERL